MNYFDDEMLRLIANPFKLKNKNKTNQDLLYNEIIYKFKKYKITKKIYNEILLLIEKYLIDLEVKKIMEELVSKVIYFNENKIIKINLPKYKKAVVYNEYL